VSRVPDLSRVPGCNSCGARLLYRLDVWGDCDRLTQIECYLRSYWNVCPLAQFKKKPIVTKQFWAGLSIAQKLDVFYHDPSLGVGWWIDSRYEVFDFDGDDHEPRADTLVSVRGPRSHAIYEASGEIYNTAKKVGPKCDIDTRASGGLLVLPPTLHQDGKDFYRWYNLAPPSSIPDTLMMLWRQRKVSGQKTGFSLDHLPDEIPYGERNSTLWSFGRSLRAAGADRDHVARRIRQANLELCNPPFSPREIERQIDHIWTHWNDPERWQAEQFANGDRSKSLFV